MEDIEKYIWEAEQKIEKVQALAVNYNDLSVNPHDLSKSIIDLLVLIHLKLSVLTLDSQQDTTVVKNLLLKLTTITTNFQEVYSNISRLEQDLLHEKLIKF